MKKEPSGPIANPTRRGPAADMNAVYNAAVKTAFDTILQHEKFADMFGKLHQSCEITEIMSQIGECSFL